MEATAVDVAPQQIVHWLRSELHSIKGEFRISATREFVSAGSEHFDGAGVSDDTDIGSVVSVGTLEVSPIRSHGQWVLTLRAEDVLGDRVPEDHSVGDEPEEIDIETFEAEFVKPGRATIGAVLRSETEGDRKQFNAILKDIIRDFHSK